MNKFSTRTYSRRIFSTLIYSRHEKMSDMDIFSTDTFPTNIFVDKTVSQQILYWHWRSIKWLILDMNFFSWHEQIFDTDIYILDSTFPTNFFVHKTISWQTLSSHRHYLEWHILDTNIFSTWTYSRHGHISTDKFSTDKLSTETYSEQGHILIKPFLTALVSP